MDSDSAVASVLEIVVPVLALALLATPVVISTLKGRWWMGLAGFVGFVGAFVITFGLFGIDEPSAEFQETVTFKVGEAALNVAFFGGIFLLLFGSVRRARPGSWWDRHGFNAKTSSPEQGSRAERTEQIMAEEPALSWNGAWRRAGKEIEQGLGDE